MPGRVGELLRIVLVRKLAQEREVFVDRLGNDVEMKALCRPRLLEHEEGKAIVGCVGEPFFDGEPIAARLRYLLAVFVQEQLVGITLRWPSAESAANPAR